MALLWLTAVIPEWRPPLCIESNYICGSATSLQLLFLCTSFGLMSVGAGGIRSSSLAFGADQLRISGSNQKNSWILGRYFSWYYATATLSVLVAFTCIVYVQDNLGWKVGFGIPFVLMLLSTLSFTLASSFYVKMKSTSSLAIEMLQVAVAAFRKRHTELSLESSNIFYYNKQGSSILPSDKLRQVFSSLGISS
ncbi:OLC1v1029028C1 [Oldenlandia corymbosa var. corymbosa]|uniref:OLC1v1029028C1 n=1 Tax=Oldenlandia corymbosa var. corymbosa TaxID=529605 RepID=A0AAV1CDH1_OLDCO|nr:OLC1v1029028C1 [Oldenlandia corymbosa var. corymbosa]